MAREGISGAALAVAAGGAVLVFAGLRNVAPSDVLRAALRGKPIPNGPGVDAGSSSSAAVSASDAGGGGTTGVAAVAAARKYLGIDYVFGGADPKTGFDCSGLITWVLHHDLGLDLPSNTHTITTQFYFWTGADTVRWDQQQPGDLVCWMSHIGMVTTPGQMIAAPHTGAKVREQSIWRTPDPIIRRPKAYGLPQGHGGKIPAI